MKRPFILACWLAAFALAAGACGTVDGLTVPGGNIFATAPSAPAAPGSTTSAIAVTPVSPPAPPAGVIPVIVILNGTDPIYP